MPTTTTSLGDLERKLQVLADHYNLYLYRTEARDGEHAWVINGPPVVASRCDGCGRTFKSGHPGGLETYPTVADAVDAAIGTLRMGLEATVASTTTERALAERELARLP